MYGGGFATVPAYLADVFGTQFVGAIHGRLLTAWSTAGIIGPVVVNYIREAQIAAGVPHDRAYDFTLYILAGMLALGFVCNWLITPVSTKWHMEHDEIATSLQPEAASQVLASSGVGGSGGLDLKTVLAWLAVGLPILWGAWITLKNAIIIFQ
jgi:hypothetical protein